MSYGFHADLHMHSYWSFDGFVSPRQLVKRAQFLGVRVMAVTEHDNLDSWMELQSFNLAGSSIHLCPGVELTSSWGDITIGVLGIGFEPSNPILASFLTLSAREDMAFLDRWFSVAESMGLPMRQTVNAWIRQLFPDFPQRAQRNVPEWILTRLLLERGFVSSADSARTTNADIVRRAGHPSVPRVYEAIDLVHQSGGIALLEHPAPALGLLDIVELMSHGFDGIELYNDAVEPGLREQLMSFIVQNRWLVTAGSDYHGIRNGWGRKAELLGHPSTVVDAIETALLQTAYGGSKWIHNQF